MVINCQRTVSRFEYEIQSAPTRTHLHEIRRFASFFFHDFPKNFSINLAWSCIIPRGELTRVPGEYFSLCN